VRVFFGNAGVMLFNVTAMRRSHKSFIEWLFKEEHWATAMDFGVYGPADQGAYNAFYKRSFDVHVSPRWNWKPYWGNPRGVDRCSSCTSTGPSRGCTARSSSGP
jgi:hypothetical protein